MAETDKENPRGGEPILVVLIEDNVDHAELVIRTIEKHQTMPSMARKLQLV